LDTVTGVSGEPVAWVLFWSGDGGSRVFQVFKIFNQVARHHFQNTEVHVFLAFQQQILRYLSNEEKQLFRKDNAYLRAVLSRISLAGIVNRLRTGQEENLFDSRRG
jgi:flagellar motor switch protein FliG